MNFTNLNWQTILFAVLGLFLVGYALGFFKVPALIRMPGKEEEEETGYAHPGVVHRIGLEEDSMAGSLREVAAAAHAAL